MAELRRRTYTRKPRNPVEVIVYDVLRKVPVIGEYRHETKVAHDGRTIYKVYHPVFEETGGARWVYHFIRKLGTFVPDAAVEQ